MSVPDAKFTKGEFQVGTPPPSPPLAFLPPNPLTPLVPWECWADQNSWILMAA